MIAPARRPARDPAAPIGPAAADGRIVGGELPEQHSPTKRRLCAETVAKVARECLGRSFDPADCREIGSAGFAAVWRVGETLVLKCAPPPQARLLAYERGLLGHEADYYRLAADVAPLPRVVYYGSSVALDGSPVLFASFLAGTPLNELQHVETADVRRELGAAVARIHRIGGARFGYAGARPSGPDWASAFAAIVDSLLDDARRFDVSLPVPRSRLRAAAASTALTAVAQPTLVHFDLWDGNVLAEETDGGWRLAGLVDGERHLYGDPLVDLVSPRSSGGSRRAPTTPSWRATAWSSTTRPARGSACTGSICIS